MNQSHETNAWSLYWSDDRLYSCVAQSSDEDQKYLNQLWQSFSQTLEPDSRLLDLATGNGAVAAALLSANNELLIDAIDKASIDPKRFLKKKGDLVKVNFHADTDIFDLLFEHSTFDAITSQFGIEYADLSKASLQVLDYLKVGGRFQYIVHHVQSGIVLSSKNKIMELEQLTQEYGVLETLIEALGGRADFAQLEAVGQDYLTKDFIRSEQVSGQVFVGIERIITNFPAHPKESLNLGVSMDLRVRSELTRLRQLIVAAQTESAMDSWQKEISAAGAEATFSPVYLDSGEQEYLLGWLAAGTRVK